MKHDICISRAEQLRAMGLSLSNRQTTESAVLQFRVMYENELTAPRQRGLSIGLAFNVSVAVQVR